MEWASIALAAAVVFLFLVILGALREVMLLRGEVAGLSQLITHPPTPSFLSSGNGGAKAPDALIQAIREAVPAPIPPRELVAFVSPGCGPCDALARDISALIDRDPTARQLGDAILFVVGAPTLKEAEAFAVRLPGRTHIDRNIALRRACEVRGTPTLFLVSTTDFHVTDYTVEGDMRWITTRLAQPA